MGGKEKGGALLQAVHTSIQSSASYTNPALIEAIHTQKGEGKKKNKKKNKSGTHRRGKKKPDGTFKLTSVTNLSLKL